MASKREKSAADIVQDVIQADQSTEQPADAQTEESAAKPAGKKVVPKTKRTFSLSVELSERIDIVASGLGKDACELVEKLLWPSMEGVRKPTIPAHLRALFGPDTVSAA